jgi:hypothetical protein
MRKGARRKRAILAAGPPEETISLTFEMLLLRRVDGHLPGDKNHLLG